MPADDVCPLRRNGIWDVRNDRFDQLRRGFGRSFLPHIGDLKPICLNQWFLSWASADYRSVYRAYVGRRGRSCFDNFANSHCTERS